MLFNLVTALVISDIVAVTFLLLSHVLLMHCTIINITTNYSMYSSIKLTSANILFTLMGPSAVKNIIQLQLVYYTAQWGNKNEQTNKQKKGTVYCENTNIKCKANITEFSHKFRKFLANHSIDLKFHIFHYEQLWKHLNFKINI